PEQAQGLVGDKRSDLYSLGIILYEMTTGVTPFRGASLMVILMQHFQDPPTPPALINPDLPLALSEVILKSIAKDPDARFPTASPDIKRASSYNPLQPSRPLGMTPAPLPPSSLQFSPPPLGSSPSAFAPPANDRHTPSTILAGSRTGSDSFPSPGTNTPASV